MPDPWTTRAEPGMRDRHCTSCWEEGDLGVQGCGDYCCCQDERMSR